MNLEELKSKNSVVIEEEEQDTQQVQLILKALEQQNQEIVKGNQMMVDLDAKIRYLIGKQREIQSSIFKNHQELQKQLDKQIRKWEKERMEFFTTQNNYHEGAFSAVGPINVGIVSGVLGASILENMSDSSVPIHSGNVKKRSEKELKQLRMKGYKVSGNEEIVDDVEQQRMGM